MILSSMMLSACAADVNGSLIGRLRRLARLIAKDLAQKAPDVRTQPGLFFFEKRIHALGDGEPDSPDGLSLDYFRLAVRKNEAIWLKEPGSPVDALAADVCREVSRAALLERVLLARSKPE